MLPDLVSVIMSTRDPLHERTQKALAHLARSDVPYELILLNRNHEWTTGTIVNQGIAASVGGYVAFCCDDCFIEPDALRMMKEALQDSAVGVAGALLRYPDGIVQHAGGTLCITRKDRPSTNGKEAGAVLAVDLKHIGQWEPMRDFETQDVDFVTGALMMTRRDVLETVGWYASDCKLSFGDVDFCFRARRSGYSVRFVSSARGVHLEASTRGKQMEAKMVADASWFLSRWSTTDFGGDVDALTIPIVGGRSQ